MLNLRRKSFFLLFMILGVKLAFAAETIKTIRIEGNQRIESETILAYVPLKVGDPFDPERIDQSLKELFATGYFTDVSVSRSGDALLIKIVENPIINRVAFEGNNKIQDDKLKEEVQLQPREAFSRTKVQAAQQRILELYRRMGRFSATVEPKIIKLDENRVDLIFEINEGEITYVRKINFIGNKKFSNRRLQSEILTKETHWYRFFAVDDVYDPDRLAADQQLLRQYYFDNGYADFRVVSAVAELSPDHKDFYITFTVEEGERYKINNVKIISKIAKVDPKSLEYLIDFSKDDWFSSKQVEKVVEKLTDAVGGLGYAFAEVRPKTDKDRKNHTLDVTFEINEGPRVYIERIDIVGNDRTRDDVIRREMRVHEGDAYNTEKLIKSEKELKDLGYFKKVEVKTEQGSTPDRARVIVGVEEQSTGELNFAGGFSTLDGPLGQIGFVERNLMGKGQIVRGSVTIAKRRQEFDLGFTEPYFLDRNLAAGVDIFLVSSSRFSSYKQSSQGGSLSLGYHLSDPLTQRLEYSIHQDRIDNVAADASQLLKEQSGSAVTSSVGQALVYDKRDSRIDPTSGYVLSLGNTFAGVGGSVKFLNNVLSGSYYYSPVEDVVLNLRAKGGVIVDTGKTIRIVDSYILGESSFRGFEFGGLGPRDSKTNDALGGTRYWIATAEAMFPIGLPNEFGVKGAAFVEAGTLWKPGKTISTVLDKRTIRASVGIGLSWTIPMMGPLRLDYAIPVKKEKFDRTQRFIVGFSTRF